MNPKVALAVGAGVFILVFLWYRNRSQNAGIPTQTQTTPQVGPQQSSQAPSPVSDSLGGVTQGTIAAPDLGAIADFLRSLPYTSYTYSPTSSVTSSTTITDSYNGYGAGAPSPVPSPPPASPPPPPGAPQTPDYTPDSSGVQFLPGTPSPHPGGIGGHF